MRHPAEHLHNSPALTALDELEVGEAPFDAVTRPRKASSVPFARRAVRLPEDECKKAFVALVPVAHNDEILGLLEPPPGRDHKLLDERLIPSSNYEADQQAALGVDRGRFPEGFLLASHIPVTLIHLYRRALDVLNPLVVELPRVIPEAPPQPSYGLCAHADKARGSLGREALREMLGHRDGLLLFDLTVEKRRVLALGELARASAAAQVADLILAVDLAHGEVSRTLPGVKLAILVGAS